MRYGRLFCVMVFSALMLLVSGLPASGQTASFTSLGDLGGGTSQAYGVSSDGTVVVGDSLDGNGKTQAFIWTTSNGIQGIGFLDGTYQESHGRAVAVDSGGTIHVTGYSKNSSNKNQAFHWSGNASGAGTMSGIPYLPGGDTSYGRGLRIRADEIFIVGRSNRSDGKNRAFRWHSSAPGGSLDLGVILDHATQGNSDAYGVGWRPNGTNTIVGSSNSNWWVTGTGNRREAFRWAPNEWGMVGTKGLDHVCGRGFQVAAGDNGVADTAADPSDVQVIDQYTTGLDREEVVVSSGADSWLQTAEPRGSGGQILDDDLLWPEGRDADGTSESLFRAVSPDGRFSVGRCTYPDEACGVDHPQRRLWQANFHDAKVKDGEPSGGHCGGTVMHFPLGFLDDDNYSEALGVSRSSLGDPSREEVVAVGWSKNVGYAILAGSNGEAETLAQCDDVQEEAVGTTGLSADTIVVSPGPNGQLDTPTSGDDTISGSYGINGSEKRAFVCFISDSYDLFGFESEMHDLKVYLEDEGLNLSGWELRETTAVSDYGGIVVGWGLHNGEEEGFIASLAGIVGPTGACCRDATLICEDDPPVPQSECQPPDVWHQGQECVADAIVCCADPFADADNDGDVDQEDFGVWQACFSGNGHTAPAGNAYPCSCFNRQGGDSDVDDLDFVDFEACWSGPTVSTLDSCDD